VSGSEHITVLFTDLVGSTELAARLEPAVADVIRQTHFSALRRAIATSGGVEVKNLGDGLMVVFTTASAGLSCAVAMQQQVDQDNRRSGQSLQMRVGLSAGEVSKEGDDYFGDPVVEAARLCAQAEGGQILASDLARASAGRRTQQAFRSLGEIELKGLPNAVGVVEVQWNPVEVSDLAEGVVPLPSRLAVPPGVGVIARSAEIDLISDALKRTSAGESREVVLINGEAGIGKTTVTAAATRRAFEEGACVLLGRCQEGLGVPYQPISEALGHFVSHAPEPLLSSHIATFGSELTRLVPTLRRRTPGVPSPLASDAETERHLLFRAVVGLIVEASMICPMVIVLDDLQWADSASLQLLRHIVATSEPMRLLVIGLYRDNDLSSSDPLVETLAALRREPHVSRIELGGFGDAEVVAFFEAAAGHDLDDDAVALAHAVYRETDGNPFFVSEVLRHLAETGAILQDGGGRWTTRHDLTNLSLPDSVREVIGARLGRLGKLAGDVLSLASVIGREFDLELLGAVTGSSVDELLDILDAARAAALVRELPEGPGRYTFAHALIQHTLYADLGATRRAHAHHGVAEALEELCGERPGDRLGELAHHWFSATKPVDLAKALAYSRQAGDAALEALAPDDALRYYSQALQLYQEIPDANPLLWVDLQIGLGTAQRQAGMATYRDTLLAASRRAAATGAIDRQVAAALANSRGFFSVVGSVDAERLAVLESAVSAVGSVASPQSARLNGLLAQELVTAGDLTRRIKLSDRAVRIARELGEPTTLLDVLNLRFNAILGLDTLQERQRVSAEAVSLAREIGNPTPHFLARIFAAFAALDAGDRDELDRSAHIALLLTNETGEPTLNWVATWEKVLLDWLDGRLDDAEQHVMDAFSLGIDSGQPDAAIVPGILLMSLRWAQGRIQEIEPVLVPLLDQEIALPGLKAGLAQLYCEIGRYGEARGLIDAEVDTEFASCRDDPYQLNTLVLWSHAIADVGHEHAAEILLPDLLPHHDEIGAAGVVTFGTAATAIAQLQGVLSRFDDADDMFEEAVNVCNRLRCPFFTALTRIAWARLVKARGDDLEVRSRLGNAAELVHQHGFHGLARRIGALVN
jgi:class 3 adenylate cyclase/tetratricopeptide (TPR) repeat protein